MRRQYLFNRGELYDLDKSCCPPAMTKAIVEATDGSPLYMDDLLRLGRILHLPQALEAWEQRRGDRLEKICSRNCAKWRSCHWTRETDIMIAASISEEPISFAELVTVLSASDERIFNALEELRTLFLFPKAPACRGEQRFALNGNTRKHEDMKVKAISLNASS